MVPETLLKNTTLGMIGYTVLLGDGCHQRSPMNLWPVIWS